MNSCLISNSMMVAEITGTRRIVVRSKRFFCFIYIYIQILIIFQRCSHMENKHHKHQRTNIILKFRVSVLIYMFATNSNITL